MAAAAQYAANNGFVFVNNSLFPGRIMAKQQGSTAPDQIAFISFNTPTLFLLDDRYGGLIVPSEYEQRDLLAAVNSMGSNTVRSYALSVQTIAEVAAGNYNNKHIIRNTTTGAISLNNNVIQALDRALFLAPQYNVRIIIPFVDRWRWLGGLEDFAELVAGEKLSNPAHQFYHNDTIISAFQDVVRQVLTRSNPLTGLDYLNDTSIFCWETGNEIDNAPEEWIVNFSSYVKSVDPYHLLMDGSGVIGVRGDIMSSSDIDIFTGHYYPTFRSTANDIVGFCLLGALIILTVVAALFIHLFPRKAWQKDKHLMNTQPGLYASSPTKENSPAIQKSGTLNTDTSNPKAKSSLAFITPNGIKTLFKPKPKRKSSGTPPDMGSMSPAQTLAAKDVDFTGGNEELLRQRHGAHNQDPMTRPSSVNFTNSDFLHLNNETMKNARKSASSPGMTTNNSVPNKENALAMNNPQMLGNNNAGILSVSSSSDTLANSADCTLPQAPNNKEINQKSVSQDRVGFLGHQPGSLYTTPSQSPSISSATNFVATTKSRRNKVIDSIKRMYARHPYIMLGVAGFFILAYLLGIAGIVIHRLHHPNLSEKIIADAKLTFWSGRPFIIGEFGLCDYNVISGVIDLTVKSYNTNVTSPLNKDILSVDHVISGALLWSLRPHSRDGGFYIHTELNGFWAYHFPGWNKNLGTGKGFISNEGDIISLVVEKNLGLNSNTVNITIPETPRVLWANNNGSDSNTIQMSWLGSFGATGYNIDFSVSNDTTANWNRIASNTPDAQPSGSALYTFNVDSVDSTTGGYLRVSAMNSAGTSDTSESFKITIV